MQVNCLSAPDLRLDGAEQTPAYLEAQIVTVLRERQLIA